jgi:hypothetical protein
VPSLLDVKSLGDVARLPAWLNVPAEAEVIGQTREAPQAGPPPAAVRAPVWVRAQAQAGSRMPSTPGSIAVQSVFSAQPQAGPQHIGLNPSGDLFDLGQNAIRHARTFARERKSFFWWYIGLYNFLYLMGMPFGAALVFTVLMLAGICLVYGLLRAMREPQATLLNSGAAATAALPYGGGGQGHTPQWSLLPSTAVAPQARSATVVVKPVVGNLTLAIYHQDTCEWAQKIPQKNRVPFASPDAARAAGYRPCHVCFQPRSTW